MTTPSIPTAETFAHKSAHYLVENVSGEIRRADDAESRAIEMLRQMGQQVLQGWGERQAEKEADALEAAHKVIRQGKKNSTGTVASEE